ncbi:MAG: CRISPR-associated endonuclease Cas2 [Deferribacteraceae bacterium]|jgi:CRISPR-associated protein Cas2|nr:CRISPR-associated endonuclease Cas2 [Deferribacteraceae bacterium]
MMVLITYDIAMNSEGAKRLRHVAKHCKDYGMRVQYSTFECEVTPSQWEELKNKLLSIYDPSLDSLRFYMLGSNWKNRVEHYGAKKIPDIFRDPLIVI